MFTDTFSNKIPYIMYMIEVKLFKTVHNVTQAVAIQKNKREKGSNVSTLDKHERYIKFN